MPMAGAERNAAEQISTARRSPRSWPRAEIEGVLSDPRLRIERAARWAGLTGAVGLPPEYL